MNMTLCECGCGQHVKANNRFVHGHNNRGVAMSSTARKHLSKVRKGMVFSAQHRKNISLSKSGVNNPNYGKPRSLQTIEKIKKSNLMRRDEAIERSAKLWQQEEYRNQLLELRNTSEFIDNASRKTKARFEDPTERKAQSERITQKWKDETYRRRLSGANANAWQGGTTPERIKLMQSDAYKQWRSDIFERDKYTCCECGNTNVFLNAHHILKYAEYPQHVLDVDNGITLCEDCHRTTFGKESDFVDKYTNVISNISAGLKHGS